MSYIISPDKDPAIFKSATLKNGIKVFHRQAEQSFGLPKVACSVVVNAGGRDDEVGKEGSAHFFEHMPFRGTKNFPSLYDLTYEIEKNGGYINAFTTDEATGYEVIVPEMVIEGGIQRIADMLLNPLMKEEDIEIERSVIIEELRNRLSNVTFFARQKLYTGLLGNHPLAQAVIGTEEALNSVQKNDLQKFHERYYNATNLILFFVGKYDEEKLLTLCEQYFGSIPHGEATKRKSEWEAPVLSDKKQVLTPEQYNRSVYMTGRVVPHTNYEEALKFRLFIDMLTSGMNSPLYQEIREKRGLAYNLGIYLDQFQDLGTLVFYVSTRFANMDEVDRIIWEQFTSILKDEDRFNEVKFTRKQAALYHEFGTGALIGSAIDLYLDYRQITPLNERMEILEKTTLKDTAEYVSQFLKKDDYLNIRINCDN